MQEILEIKELNTEDIKFLKRKLKKGYVLLFLLVLFSIVLPIYLIYLAVQKQDNEDKGFAILMILVVFGFWIYITIQALITVVERKRGLFFQKKIEGNVKVLKKEIVTHEGYDSDTISSVSNEIPYKMATPAAFGVGLIHKSKRFADWDFNSYAHINGILLGATLSDHYKVSERNYNLASGFGWKTGINISYKDKIGVSWLYEGYRLYTWKGYPEGTDLATVDYNELNAQGDKSNATFNTSSLRVDLKLRDQWYLTGIGSFYRRSTHYKYFDSVYSKTGEGKLMLTYKF